MNKAPIFRNGLTLAEYDRKLAMLRGLSTELGVPAMPDMHIGIKVTDRDGKVLEDRYEQGHSWTRNAWNMFNCLMMDSPSNVAASTALEGTFRRGMLSARVTSGGLGGNTTQYLTNRTASYVSQGFQGAISTSTYGIQLGRSTEPFSGEDFVLWDLINQGTGTGQLSYQQQPTPVVVWNDGASTFTTTYTRICNNNSSAAVVVNEVGFTFNDNIGFLLLSRDVLGSPVNVPVGGQITTTITITTTSFAALEATCVAPPAAAGASYGGGIYIGWVGAWTNSNTLGGALNSHTKYALILAPKTGGEIASRQAYTSGTQPSISLNDISYGKNNSDVYVGYGASSTIGTHCAAQNAASLGGFNDWYIPSQAELVAVSARYASIPGGEQPSNAAYWTSSFTTTTLQYSVNPVTGAVVSGTNPNTSLTCRLVRRIKL